MVRGVFLFVGALSFIGCASPTPAPAPVAQAEDHAITASLTMDPAFLADDPPLDIRRDVRQAAAFAGFEDLVVTSYWLYQNDHQRDRTEGWRGGLTGSIRGDRFDRQAVTQKSSVSYR